MDATGGEQAAEEVRDGARDFALTLLERANLRLTEVEAELRRTRRERDELGRSVRALEAAFSEAATPEAGFLGSEAGRIASLVTRLSVTQRRDMWLAHLTQVGLEGPLQWLYPHAGGGDPLAFLVVGSGGFGDVLSLTPVIRELRRTFRGARVFVAHQHPGVELLSDLPFVDGVQHGSSQALERLVAGASVLDVFDLVVDVRYVVTYTAPPLSRVPSRFLIAAHTRSAKWQPYVVMNWPHLNNALAREAGRQGMGQLDVTGYTANLDVSRHSPLSLTPARPAALGRRGAEESAPEWRRLVGRPYVTIHHGADRNMAGKGGVQTKNLPVARWERIVEALRAADIEVVQLGDSEETRIAGDIVDLRGALAFRETAYVVAGACAHIDSEGGLVHAARAMFTPSVVAFGPTSISFFGYPGNANIAPSICGDCWWTSQDWSRRCMRGLATPECMESHASGDLVAAALGFARHVRVLVAGDAAPASERPAAPAPAAKFGLRNAVALLTKKPTRAPLPEIVFPGAGAGGPASTLAQEIAAVAAAGSRGLILFETMAEIRAFALTPSAERVGEIAAPAEIWREADAEFADDFTVHPVIRGHLSMETDGLDWLILAGTRRMDRDMFDLLLSAARCVKPGGAVRARLRGQGAGDEARVRQLVEDVAGFSAQRLGDVADVDLTSWGRHVASMLSAEGVFHLALTPRLAPREAASPLVPASEESDA